jgi:hypothetical protein
MPIESAGGSEISHIWMIIAEPSAKPLVRNTGDFARGDCRPRFGLNDGSRPRGAVGAPL